jgi:hypothetical protein
VCPSNDALLCYFERRLAPDAVRQIATHLDDCDACRTVVVILVRLYSAVERQELREADIELAADERRDPVELDLRQL